MTFIWQTLMVLLLAVLLYSGILIVKSLRQTGGRLFCLEKTRQSVEKRRGETMKAPEQSKDGNQANGPEPFLRPLTRKQGILLLSGLLVCLAVLVGAYILYCAYHPTIAILHARGPSDYSAGVFHSEKIGVARGYQATEGRFFCLCKGQTKRRKRMETKEFRTDERSGPDKRTVPLSPVSFY